MNEYEAYTPSEEQVRVSYMGDRIAHDGLSGEEALAEWTAFLARVRRDAAREALDGLIADTAIDVRLGTEGNDPQRVQDAEAVMDAAHIYRITEYPEETP